jgi:3-isopropylmalate dehydrogenase
MNKTITVVAGDGIGPEITAEAVRVLETVASLYGHTFTFGFVPAGGCAIDLFGEPLPEESLNACLRSDSVLLGAIGGPKWDDLDAEHRPEKALFGLRSGLNVYANIRPASLFPPLKDACPLRRDIAASGLDLVIVRELTGGLYFGKRGTDTDEAGKQRAFDTLVYSEDEIERIVRRAFLMALRRRCKVCSVDKANVLDTSRLWRKVAHRVAKEYPKVEYSDMLVDNCAMQLVRNPAQFDVIVTENMFGDILSDEASMLTGSIGLIPSMSIGDGTRGLYEPIHGSAPDIAGQDRANPVATILSCAMMLRYSFGLAAEADAVEHAVLDVLSRGIATADILRPGGTLVGCAAMGAAIREALRGQ